MADQNRNPGSKQGDGDASESFESHPGEKRGSGGAGKSDGMNKSKSGSGRSSNNSGYSAGSKDVDESGEIERPENTRTNRDTTMDR